MRSALVILYCITFTTLAMSVVSESSLVVSLIWTDEDGEYIASTASTCVGNVCSKIVCNNAVTNVTNVVTTQPLWQKYQVLGNDGCPIYCLACEKYGNNSRIQSINIEAAVYFRSN